MRGVILAGGSGTRLFPLTKVTNKHLLPIYDTPMIYYPLRTLINAGIKDIHIISGRGHAGHILELLGDGNIFGVKLSYSIQEEPKGIAHALGLAKEFVDGDNVAVILGDNIFEDIFNFASFRSGARLYLKEVENSHRFGCAFFNKEKIVKIVEKPQFDSKPRHVVTGLYLYDNSVFDVIGKLKPSERNEFEITDVNNAYIKQNLSYEIVSGFWSDAGTFESLYAASTFMKRKNGL